jgi:hypothetical protein
MAFEKSFALNWNTHNLRCVPVGSEIILDISGLSIGAEQLTPDLRWVGKVVDPNKAFVDILEDSQGELDGQTIGLASGVYFQPRLDRPDTYPIIMQKVLVPYGRVAHYNPEDIDNDYQGCARLEKIHRVMGYYAHVVADGDLLF